MHGDEEGSYEIVPGEDAPDRPRVVDEAYEVLATYTRQLVGTAAATAALGLVALYFDAPDLLLWPALVIGVLLLLYFAPVTREPRLARDVLRRWDQLRVERALESAGVTGDARLEVAESMAERIVRHPTADQRVRDATGTLLKKMGLTIQDLRRVEYLADARSTLEQGSEARSISDIQDLLDARAAEVLSQIAEIHHTVVLRDASALERVMRGVEELIIELEAEREVERLISDAERK